jgi:hypothetical protein
VSGLNPVCSGTLKCIHSALCGDEGGQVTRCGGCNRNDPAQAKDGGEINDWTEGEEEDEDA